MAKTKKHDDIRVPVVMLPIEDIIPDSEQPRKNAADSLGELVNSIKQHGLLQPVLVWFDADTEAGKYKLVFGHRRLLAAKEAGLTHIPARIDSKLKAADVLEIQIIENIQRRDVPAMDEAEAFLKLKRLGLTIEEISLRIGKSDKFVSQRLSLNDLIVDFKEMLMQNKISIKHSLMLARLSPEYQKYVLNHEGEEWKDNEFYIFRSDYLLTNKIQSLKEATFDREDPNLLAWAPKCSLCKYNSSCNALLFNEDEACMCSNYACYEAKTKQAFLDLAAEAAKDPDVVFVKQYAYDKSAANEAVKSVESLGVITIDADGLEVIESDEYEIQDFETFKEEEFYRLEDEDEDEEAKEEYEKHIAQRKKEIEALEQRKAAAQAEGLLKKAFIVTGTNKGRMVEVILENKVSAEAGDDDELQKILNKEKRAKEIDREKIWEKVRNLINDEENLKILSSNDILIDAELDALLSACRSKVNWNYRKMIGEEEVSKALRLLILSCISPGGTYDDTYNYTFFSYIKSLLPNQVNAIVLEQESIAANRAEKVQKRIDVLK